MHLLPKPLRLTAVLAIFSVLVLGAASCGSSSGTTSNSTGTASASGARDVKGLKVGLIMGGPKNDKGFYQAGFEGIQKAASDMGIQPTVVENVTPPQAEQTFRDLADAGNKVIIGMGADFEDGGVAAAPIYPNVQFIVMNGRKTLANLATYQLREGQAAFLAAYLVALQEPASTTFGLVGGIEIPVHLALRDGLKVALQQSGKNGQLVAAFTGSFTDVTLAKEAATAQMNNGAKVLVPWSGSAVDGAIAAASSKPDVKIIAALVDRCGTNPQITASAVTNPGGLIQLVLKEYASASWKADTSKAIGLETPTVAKVVACGTVAPDVQTKVDAMKKQLIDGTVPGLPAGV